MTIVGARLVIEGTLEICANSDHEIHVYYLQQKPCLKSVLVVLQEFKLRLNKTHAIQNKL